MGQLSETMEADLKIAGYSPSTRKIYRLYARQFARFHMRPPEEMGAREIRRFLLHLVDCGASAQTIRQARCGIRFLYAVTLGRPVEVDWIPLPRRGRRLPVILSRSEVKDLLGAVRATKYRTVLMVMYGAGLRITEACKLRPGDIDSDRMVLRVEAGKGNRDRYTMLSPRLLDQLRSYWRDERPSGSWLFPGKTDDRHLSREGVRKVFHKAVAAARIRKSVTPHVLRHSFATHLLESGVDMTVIQFLLGHSSVKVTQVYAHVRAEHVAELPSPLDALEDTILVS